MLDGLQFARLHQQFRSEFSASGLRFLTNTLPYASVYPDGGVARPFVDPVLMEREVTRYLADDVAGWHEVSALFRHLSPALLALQIAAMPSRENMREVSRYQRHLRSAVAAGVLRLRRAIRFLM